MRIFTCEHCGSRAAFEADHCSTCAAALGYDSRSRRVRVLEPTGDDTVFWIDGVVDPVWRCLNAAWGCNWVVPTDSESVWCRSCGLTRGRPDEARVDAVTAWAAAEVAKRRLIHQLDELALPIVARSESAPDGLAFDLVHVPGAPAVTGHLGGIVTFDLVETDERHREELRRNLGETFRTVIGHLRHEIAHYYWGRLVGQTDEVTAFRRLFGDESADYSGAIDRHYGAVDGDWDRTRFVTAYAGSHPLEDWAETFAHYLHILDAIDTATAHDLIIDDRAMDITAANLGAVELEEILAVWAPINVAMNAVAMSLGAPLPYPFEPVGLVIDKLAFVHRQVVAHADRDRFYAC